MAQQRASDQNAPARPRPAPRPAPQKSGGSAGLILGIVGIVLAIAAGAYAWMNINAYKQETAQLRSKVKMLENRADYTESAIVQLVSGDEILPATSADDANVVINKQGEKDGAATTAKAKDAPRPQANKQRTVNAKKSTTPKPRHSARRSRKTKTAKAVGSETVPATFGDTYTPPTHVHYAVFIDSFGDRRTADITKASLAVRYGAYIRKLGNRYNVYAGWYRDMSDARAILRLLSREYGPSCRIETLYK